MREVVEGIWWWDSVGLFIRSAPFKENGSSYVTGLSPPTALQKPYIMGLECWCLFVLTIIEVYFLDFIFTERQIIYYFCIRSFPFSHDLVFFNYLFLVRVFKKLFFLQKSFMCEIHKYVKSIIFKKILAKAKIGISQMIFWTRGLSLDLGLCRYMYILCFIEIVYYSESTQYMYIFFI